MTDSLPPRRSLRPSPEKVWAGVKFAATVLATVGGTLLAFYKWVESHVTEAELAAHEAPLLERLGQEEAARHALAAEIEKQRQEAERDRRALFELFWIDVGVKAAELQPDARKKARSADHARDRFEEDFRRGTPLEEAYRRALARGMP